MIEQMSSMMKGHVTIKDADTGEVIVDKDNAVHYGNMSTTVARALAGTSTAFISYMAFGNGGATIDAAGSITYGAAASENGLHSTTYLHRLTNEATPDVTDPMVTVPGDSGDDADSPYETIRVVMVLDTVPTDADVNDLSSPLVGDYVFNELALYSGTTEENLTVDNLGTTDDALMLTHVIFHPVLKSQNRTLEITYTLRIQMGEGEA